MKNVKQYMMNHKKGVIIGAAATVATAAVAVALVIGLSCRTSAVPPVTEDTMLQASVTEPTELPTEKPEPSRTETTESSKPQPTEPTSKPTEPTSKPTEPSKPQATEPTSKPTEPTEPPHQHSYSAGNPVAASCESGGYTVYACACGSSYQDDWTAALGHSYESSVVAPTTESGGYTVHTCSRCGDIYKDSYTDKLDKTYDLSVDLDALVAAGNAYALSIGFGSIDWSLNLDNSGYYPGMLYAKDYVAEAVIELGFANSAQEYLLNKMYSVIDSTKNQLVARFEGYGEGDTISDCCVMAYASYDASTGYYKLNLLYS